MSTVSQQSPATQEPRAVYPLPKKHWGTVALIVVAALVAISAILYAWQLGPFRTTVVSTDNAYVRGRTTVIAPQVSGYVVSVAAKDYQQVSPRQLLVAIDDRTYRAVVDQAKAALDAQVANLRNLDQAHASRVAAVKAQVAGVDSAKAQLLRARADLSRVNDLVSDGSVSVREQDQLRASLAQSTALLSQSEATHDIALEDVRTVEVSRDGLKAQIESAKAQLRKAEIDLENTQVLAPDSGQVGEVGVRLGQYVTNGTQLLSLVPHDRWVIANFKETETVHMRKGQPAWITVDALGGQRINGHVEELSPGTGSEFSVVKPDNGTGNFVKIPQRIGVRIVFDAATAGLASLRPGMSVEAHVDTSSYATN